MDLLVSSRKPFGLPTNFKDYVSEPTADKNIKIYRNGGVGFTSFDAIPKKDEYFDSIKVLVSKASPGADDYPHLVFSEPIIAEKGTACTETYLVVSTVSNTDQANHLKRYMATKFFRFLVLLVKNTQDVPKRVYAYVPQQNLNDEWNDEKLYSKYGITKEEVDFINTLVKDVVW